MLSRDIELTVGAITGAREFINNAQKEEGEKAHMWKAVMEHEEECRAEGRAECRAEGRAEGIMAVVTSYHELGATQRAAAEKLVSGFGISSEQAWTNVRQYWGR